MITAFTTFFNYSLIHGVIPNIFCHANVCPLPKPNQDLKLSTSYRPISLTSVVNKSMERILTSRIWNCIGNHSRFSSTSFM